MKRPSLGLIAKVKKEVEGLLHSEAEGFGMSLASAAAGEPVQFLCCRRGELTGWIDADLHEKPRAQLTDTDRDLIAKSGFTEVEVLAHVPARRPQFHGELSEEDRAEIEKLGLDPKQVSAAMTAKDYAEYLAALEEEES